MIIRSLFTLLLLLPSAACCDDISVPGTSCPWAKRLDCTSQNIVCFDITSGGLVPHVSYSESEEGLRLDFNNDKVWTIVIKHKKLTTWSGTMDIGVHSFTVGVTGQETKKGITIDAKAPANPNPNRGITTLELELKPDGSRSADPIADILEFYKDPEQKIVFNQLKSDKIDFYKGKSCDTEPAHPQQAKMDGLKYSCEPSQEIYIGHKKQSGVHVVYCSKRGWRKENGDFIDKFDKQKLFCDSQCNEDFRTVGTGTERPTTTSKFMISCGPGKLLEYTYGKDPAVQIEGDMHCDDKGWKANSQQIVTFGNPLHPLKVKCISVRCSDLIKNTCNSRKGCEAPIFDGVKFVCKSPSTILLHGNILGPDGVKCTDTEFTDGRGITVQRSGPRTTFDAACISKCDDSQFINIVISTGNLQVTNDKKDYECKDEGYYTKFAKEGGTSLYSAGKFKCDPSKGWSSPEHREAMKFSDGKYKVDVTCHDACKDRWLATNVLASKWRELATYDVGTRTLTCTDDRVMRFENGEDWIKETLTCSKKQIIRNTDQNVIVKLDVNDHTRKFGVDCVLKCYEKYHTNAPHVGDYAVGVPRRADDGIKLTCDPDQILKIQDKRIFTGAKCDSSKGWVEESNPNNVLVGFTGNDYKTTAECYDVCNAKMVEQTNAQEPTDTRQTSNYQGAGSDLECEKYYRLFVNNQERTKPLKCSKKGWSDGGPTMFINYENPKGDPTKKVSVICRHACNKHFIKYICDTTTNPSCSEPIYANKKLSCSHPSDILKIEYGSNAFESFSDLKCSDLGWKGTEAPVVDIPFSGEEYHVKVWCEQLCHVSRLTGLSEGRPMKFNVVNGTYELTCSEMKQMLKFKSVDVYSNMWCSKKGWLSTFGKNDNPNDPIYKFPFKQGDDENRENEAICVKNECLDREITEACTGLQDECKEPDYKTVKYRMTCPIGMGIIRASKEKSGGIANVDVQGLKCVNDVWMDFREHLELGGNEEFDFKCIAGACSQCNRKEDSEIKCTKDENCLEPDFTKGTPNSCSRYKCAYGYKSINGGVNTYYESVPGKSIQCGPREFGADDYHTPDHTSTVTTFGCVKQIPCTEHSPLNVTCAGVARCDDEFLSKLQTDELAMISGTSTEYKQPPATTCVPPYVMYSDDGNDKYTMLEHIQCQKNGQWRVKFLNNSRDKELNKDERRIFCSLNDPTRPSEMDPTKPCDNCLNPPAMTCSDCESDMGKITRTLEKAGNDSLCIATSSTGRISFNKDKETSDRIHCGDSTGYKWKTKDGKTVNEMAARKVPLSDKVNILMIVGIGVTILILIIVTVAIIIYVYLRRKKEAKRLEALKNKGLEQKNDSIIDNQSVESTKTILL